MKVAKSCQNCIFLHKGTMVDHNHCEHPWAPRFGYDSMDERANGLFHRKCWYREPKPQTPSLN